MKILLALMALVVAITPASAYAQQDSRGFRLKPPQVDERMADPGDPVAMAHETMRCFSKRDAAREWLRTVPASDEEIALMNEANERLSKCMPDSKTSDELNQKWTRARLETTLTVSTSIQRGMLAEALLHRYHDDAVEALAEERAQIEVDEFAPERFTGGRSDDDARTMEQAFGACVAGISNRGSAALLLTEPNSDEEMAQLKDMIPELSACVMQGQNLAIDPPMLRGAIAQGLYYGLMLNGGSDA